MVGVTDVGTILDLTHFLSLPCVLKDQVMHEGFVGIVMSHAHIIQLMHSESTYKANVL